MKENTFKTATPLSLKFWQEGTKIVIVNVLESSTGVKVLVRYPLRVVKLPRKMSPSERKVLEKYQHFGGGEDFDGGVNLS